MCFLARFGEDICLHGLRGQGGAVESADFHQAKQHESERQLVPCAVVYAGRVAEGAEEVLRDFGDGRGRWRGASGVVLQSPPLPAFHGAFQAPVFILPSQISALLLLYHTKYSLRVTHRSLLASIRRSPHTTTRRYEAGLASALSQVFQTLRIGHTHHP